jgi:hypothetical protein
MMTWNTARVSWVAVAVGVGLAAPSSAAALDPEVNYDPGTLSGKEYVIPLAGGRSDGAGTTDQVGGGSVAFGVGIRPPGGRSGRGGGPDSAASGQAPGTDGVTGAGSAGGSGGSRSSGSGRSSAAGRGGGGSTRADPRAAGQGGGPSHGGDLRSRIRGAEDVGGTGGRTLLILLAVLLPAALLAALLQGRSHLSRGRAA